MPGQVYQESSSTIPEKSATVLLNKLVESLLSKLLSHLPVLPIFRFLPFHRLQTNSSIIKIYKCNMHKTFTNKNNKKQHQALLTKMHF